MLFPPLHLRMVLSFLGRRLPEGSFSEVKIEAHFLRMSRDEFVAFN